MKQKGQGIVEFAVVVPILVALGISIVYIGIMFLDYTQYSNAARDAARDIALQMKMAEGTTDSASASSSIATARANLVKSINAQNPDTLKRYATALTTIYSPHWKATFYDSDNKALGDENASKAVDIEVSITLSLSSDTNGKIFGWDILPTQLQPITYRMALETANVIFVTKD